MKRNFKSSSFHLGALPYWGSMFEYFYQFITKLITLYYLKILHFPILFLFLRKRKYSKFSPLFRAKGPTFDSNEKQKKKVLFPYRKSSITTIHLKLGILPPLTLSDKNGEKKKSVEIFAILCKKKINHLRK